MTNLLAKEILQKEELLLRETKAKLIEQLNRLKVEEVALQLYVSDNSKSQPTQTSDAQIFENGIYTDNPGYDKDTSTYTDDANTLNKMPLGKLKLDDTKFKAQDQEMEEEEEDD